MIPQPEFYYSPSTSASSLSAVDPPSHPDPWLAPWMTPTYYQQPTIQLQLPDIETLPIQRPLLLADDPYKAQQSLGPDQPSLIVPTAPCDYPTAVYAPRALQLALHPVPVPMSVPVLPPPLPQASRAPAQASAPAPADVPIACPTPLHAYNKFDALLDFDPDDLLRHGALHSTPSRPRQPTAVPVPAPAPAAPPAASNPVAQPATTQHRRKRPHDECDPEPVSPRSKRARRSFSGSGVPERLTYPAAGAAPAVAREAPRHAPAAAPRARRAPPADRSHPHARPLHHVPHCYTYSYNYASAPSWNHHAHPHAVVAHRPAR